MATKNYNREYRRTKNGLLRKAYARMKARVNGRHTKSPELYHGLPLMPIEEFLNWAKSNTNFDELFDNWEKSDYDVRLTPTVDRIDSAKGYVKDNIQFLAHAVNSRKAQNKRWKNVQQKV